MAFPRSAFLRFALAASFSVSLSFGYTVLTHEAIIDSVWDNTLQKLLLLRFPASTPLQLQQAHAYAYGGCIIQDAGYYPFSSRFFSDLTHYVRSGDFITALLRESSDLNEYAFALGALEHYVADIDGHRIATNRAVPILYPKLRRKYGDEVTYWESPTAHIRTEFSFDAIQVAAGHYAPDQYRSFIGFEVSKEALERAFLDTYDIEMKDVFTSVPLALGSYRWTVSTLVPTMTRVAWSLKQNQIRQDIPGITRKKFLYNLSRSSYEKDFGAVYHKPGLWTRFLAFIFRVLPATGPFSALHIPAPVPEVEKLFMTSFNSTIDGYKARLALVENGGPPLINENFDAGGDTVAGRYQGTDEAYEKLLAKLDERHFAGLQADLRDNILAYYKDLKDLAPQSAPGEGPKRVKLLGQIARLKAADAGSTTQP